MINVGVIAASGYAGAETVRLLLNHPQVNLNYITSRRFVGKYFHTIYPNLRKISKLKFEELDIEEAAEKCDVTFLATPHGISQEFVPTLMERGLKIIDQSADFRLNNKHKYKEYYKKEHGAAYLFKEAVYGLPELHRYEIRNANLIAVAGCHASSAIYGLYPLISEGLIDIEKIIIDSKTGSSGSGATSNKSTHHPVRANSIRPYKMTNHRHTAEIEQELALFKNKNEYENNVVRVGFSAHAVNLVRGILSTIHIFYNENREIDNKKLFRIYRKYYENEPFLRLINQNTGVFRLPDPKIVKGTNYCDIGFELDPHMNRIVVLSALDNLIKGTAGNAVQCLNIMNGLDEKTALEFPGFFPL
ncbi:MAG: N-acetyl-gamma-glutamyl-phosphate reductase [Candidatus Lokiarchaeota archaeon]|nr:N-acetyl-gamma-glutamyl-phosphate reductase [Candidatus Lokiarchaeota archaeon]MBD3201378.1 N-acetyl-gamma-glutamyl-phosphate reductase [Candidatus Lokiarchaeota archaeon]